MCVVINYQFSFKTGLGLADIDNSGIQPGTWHGQGLPLRVAGVSSA